MVDFKWFVEGGLRPIPTLASMPNCVCSKGFRDMGVQTDTRTDTKSGALSELSVTGFNSPNTL